MADDDDTGDKDAPKGIRFTPEEIAEHQRELDKQSKFSVIEGGKGKDAAKPKPAGKAKPKQSANEDSFARELETNDDLKGVIAFDTFSARPIRLRPIPGVQFDEDGARPWADGDDVDLLRWFQRNGYVGGKLQTLRHALMSYTLRTQYSAAVDHLRSLPKWDQTPRLATFFRDVCGSVSITERQTRYLKEVATRFIIQMINRIMDPGCQADIVPILEGAQGTQKSTLCRLMAMKDEWFTDHLASNLDAKDTRDHLKGKSLIELSELAVMKGARRENLKGFVTARDDQQRKVWGTHESRFLRQCVFIGTTNETGGYLADTTGNRRWLPVMCGDAIDIKLARKILPQVFAEAFYLWQCGENAYFPMDCMDIVREEQSKREAVDPWFDRVLEGVMKEMERSEAIGEAEFWTRTSSYLGYIKAGEDGAKQRSAEMEIAQILRQLGGRRDFQRHGLPSPVSWYVFNIADFRKKYPPN